MSMCSALGSVLSMGLYCVSIHCIVLMGTDNHCALL